MPIDIAKIRLFRIVHVDNVKYILRHGMFTKHHTSADPNYINIGDTKLIKQRNEYPVKLEGYGNLGDYVPFYFGPLSPMLLNIKTGYRGIVQRPQSDIAYICSKLDQIIDAGSQWCFTDGHAKNRITEFYNDVIDLDNVDWKIVSERYWKNTEEDLDRMRRKQAEFLVKDHVPVQVIKRIIIYDENKREMLQKIADKLKLKIKICVNPNNNYYY